MKEAVTGNPCPPLIKHNDLVNCCAKIRYLLTLKSLSTMSKEILRMRGKIATRKKKGSEQNPNYLGDKVRMSDNASDKESVIRHL